MTQLSLDQAALLTAGAAMWATPAVPEAGIPSFTMSDGPMGIASGKVDERDIARLSPCATALGASWDVDLARRIGTLVGQEAAARGIDMVLAPNINLARSPLAGRAFEYFSEDPLLAGLLGAAWIGGLQSTGTGSCAKHLVCNDSETARDSMNVVIDERTLREVYLLPFEFAAQAGCAGMLAAYNRVNGSYCAEQHHVLTEVVKGEWGYHGVIMSDWFGTHSTAPTLAAGLDLEMPGPARFLGAKAAVAVGEGALSEARVQDAALRVAHAAQRVTGPKSQPLAEADITALLEEAAAAGMVLLKNEAALLPLDPTAIKTLAVIGPNAAAPCFQGGTFAKISVRPDLPSPIDAIRARFGAQCAVLFEPGVDPAPRLPLMPVTPAHDIGDGCTSGMTLDYFATPDCSGAPLNRETRDTNSLVWFAGMHDQAPFAKGGSIRAAGRFTAGKSGTHRFHLGATGVSRLMVDGREVLATTECPPGDTMGVLKAGDSESAPVDLAAGQTVTVTAEFSFTGARVHGLWYGIRAPGSGEELLAAAETAARAADAVVLIVGETSDSSVESKDRPDTLLAAGQRELIARVTAANPRVAVVTNVGHAYDAAWERAAAAHLATWYPGEGFAAALAAVLAGDREPGGRMPVTIAREEADYPAFALKPTADGALPYREGTRLGYRGIASAHHTLGAGQGYARFAWSQPIATADGVSLTVTNLSNRAGAEVVQVYRDAPEPTLIGFAKVHLEPGKAASVTVPLTRRRFAVWGESGGESGWQLLTAPNQVRIARNAEDPGFALEVDAAALPDLGP
ncbi:glycoside hydrolase family 3 C-terminal domain-containing protein [Novosphingobium sp. PASSN1]|uniref:beta-glucosidase n=1 Tax=Novosphingobium sp. PASSN1 TaxID=2015561 RepID=UPI000BCDDF78|nr:glycoside hydrolase family 3 C-terminal domain-containing protein [Novosphingobium sp. PASSN1]OYU35411.1 MAG: beta-glucosidase [Novosphingobium sp. PASSN1]